MNRHGDDTDVLVAARSALLDALEALRPHIGAVVVVGAQAIYLHTGSARVALAPATKDSDLVLNAPALAADPRLEEAMRAANFTLDPHANQPGAWLSPSGIPVDLMVPEALAGPSGRRGVRIPPHAKNAARRTVGLEAAVVDCAPMEVRALAPDDKRSFVANVAGPAALLVAKLHKVGEREADPDRLVDKDAHDIFRLLRTVSTEDLAAALGHLRAHPLAKATTEQGLRYLTTLFAAGPRALGSRMAGRAEQGVGDPVQVAVSVAFLAEDLVTAVGQTV